MPSMFVVPRFDIWRRGQHRLTVSVAAAFDPERSLTPDAMNGSTELNRDVCVASRMSGHLVRRSVTCTCLIRVIDAVLRHGTRQYGRLWPNPLYQLLAQIFDQIGKFSDR